MDLSPSSSIAHLTQLFFLFLKRCKNNLLPLSLKKPNIWSVLPQLATSLHLPTPPLLTSPPGTGFYNCLCFTVLMAKVHLPTDIPLDMTKKEREEHVSHGISVRKSCDLPLPLNLTLQFPGVFTRKWFGFVWLLTCHLLPLFVCFLYSKFSS